MIKKFTIFSLTMIFSFMAMSAQLRSVNPRPGGQYNPQYGDLTLEFSEGLTNITPVYSLDPELPDMISYYLYDGNVYLNYTDTEGELQSIEIPHSYEIKDSEGESSWVNVIEVQDRGTGIPKYLTVKIADGSFVLPDSKKTPFDTAMDNADLLKGFSVVFEKVEVGDKPCTSTNLSSVDIDSEGTITINYLFPEISHFVDASWPEEFRQSWPEGDPRGIATLNFDGPVGDFMPILIYFGTFGSDDLPPLYTLSKQKVTLEDNKMIIDFTGIDYKNYSYTQNDVVTIRVEGVETPDGLPVYFRGTSSSTTKEIKYINKPVDEEDEPVIPEVPLPIITPDLGDVEELALITLEWEGYDLKLNSECEESVTMTLNGEIAEQEIIITVTGDSTMPEYDGNILSISFGEEILEEGNYEITLPTGLVILGNEEYTLMSQEVVLSYTILTNTNVETLAVDGKFEVYSLSGRKVFTTTDVNDIKSLDRGIYVINGKKVMLRN